MLWILTIFTNVCKFIHPFVKMSRFELSKLYQKGNVYLSISSLFLTRWLEMWRCLNLFLMFKVSDYKMALNFQADIINGPTLGTGLSPFSWTTEFNQTHMGLPTTYNFDFQRTSPKFRTPWAGRSSTYAAFRICSLIII